MNERAEHLKRLLALEPHVEGGHYRRIHESSTVLSFGPGAEQRAAASSIYYLLCAGEVSRWHRIDADEVWHWYEGEPIEMLRLDPGDRVLTRHRLGPLDANMAPVFVVPAGCWQAARPLGQYALVGCTVAPGFEWQGFSTLEGAPDIAACLGDIDESLLSLA